MWTELRKVKERRESQNIPRKGRTKERGNRKANRLETRATTVARVMVLKTAPGEISKPHGRAVDGLASLTAQTRARRMARDRKVRTLERTVKHVTDAEKLAILHEIVGFVW